MNINDNTSDDYTNIYNINACNIKFGKWKGHLSYLNNKYNRLIDKFIQFILEVGVDPYHRVFDIEPFIDFAIKNDITHKSADFIYRHRIYNMMIEKEAIKDADKEDYGCIYSQFYLLPEGCFANN